MVRGCSLLLVVAAACFDPDTTALVDETSNTGEVSTSITASPTTTLAEVMTSTLSSTSMPGESSSAPSEDTLSPAESSGHETVASTTSADDDDDEDDDSASSSSSQGEGASLSSTGTTGGDPCEAEGACGVECGTLCALGEPCSGGPDCDSGICTNNVCTSPGCNDGVHNGSESDVDCGRVCPDRCEDGLRCNVSTDCASRVCTEGYCGARSCVDLGGCDGDSCCVNLELPAGTGASFMIGSGESLGDSDYHPEALSNEQPETLVSISGVLVDKYEVTVGRFRSFVESQTWLPEAGAGAVPGVAGTGWQSPAFDGLPSSVDAWNAELSCHDAATWTTDAGENETMPINCVSWYAAFAFCIWDGGRLPTEAEWEFAAAGGSEDRLFPWGAEDPQESTPARAVMNQAQPEQVGSRQDNGNGRWGHADLSGNLSEWVFDYFAVDYYDTLQVAVNCQDCPNTTPASTRVFRGGSYLFVPSNAFRSAARSSVEPTTRSRGLGFRCARPL